MTRIVLCLAASGALAGGCAPGPTGNLPGEDVLVIFDNGSGPMCLDALAWLAAVQTEHPELVVEEHLTTDPASLVLLTQLKSRYPRSQGASTTFVYLPIIFFRGQAFSGFNGDVRETITGLIESAEPPAS